MPPTINHLFILRTNLIHQCNLQINRKYRIFISLQAPTSFPLYFSLDINCKFRVTFYSTLNI